MTVNLDQPMRNMSVSQRQMCEIAKAISYNSKVIVLDEPTSSLTVQEVDKLFDMMRMLRDQGISLIYIPIKWMKYLRSVMIFPYSGMESGHDKKCKRNKYE